jgi:hypothetical protein
MGPSVSLVERLAPFLRKTLNPSAGSVGLWDFTCSEIKRKNRIRNGLLSNCLNIDNQIRVE